VRAETGVLGTFARPAQAACAIRRLKECGFNDIRTAMPAPFAEVVAALGRPRSPVGYLALPGAAFGFGCGLALTILTSLSWRIVTGGKPVVSLPAFVVIAFELSVLMGAIANLVAVGIGTCYGGRRAVYPGTPRCSGEEVAVFVAGGDRSAAEAILRDNGATEVSGVA
jgi:Alternative complex III, ActD subunit